MPPLVSILIPAYNAKQSLAQTIRSALAQSWPRKEIIVVDDGSKDGTLALAQQFAAKNVAVLHQENQGAAATRNHAFSRAQGDYIQWLDADDLLSPDKLARQLALQERLSSRRFLLSCEWGSFYRSPRRARFQKTPLWQDLSPTDWLVHKLHGNVFMQTGVWLVSRELSEAAGPWDARLLSDDDGEYFCRVMLASDGVRFVPGAKVFYRVPGLNSLSSVWQSRRKLEALLLSMRLHIDYLRSQEDSPRVRAAAVAYLQTGLPLFYPECPDLVEKIRQLAADLGGQLAPVRLSWKYSWIQKAFGWPAAKHAQARYDRLKRFSLRGWDWTLSRFETHD